MNETRPSGSEKSTTQSDASIHASKPVEVYVYLRVSTDKQDEHNQLPAIKSYCRQNDLPLVEDSEHIIEDHAVSGFKKSWKDRKINDVLNRIQVGSHLLFYDVSRLGRIMYDLVEFAKKATTEKKVTLHFIKQGLLLPPEDSALYQENAVKASMSKMMLGLFAGLAEVERETFRARVDAGLKRAKSKGKKFGGQNRLGFSGWKRKQGIWKDTQFYDSKLFDSKRDEIVAYLRAGQSQASLCKKYGWKPSSLCMYVKRHKLKSLIKKDDI